MPRTVVAGQGVQIWRRGWIRIAILLLWGLAIIVFAPYAGATLLLIVLTTIITFAYGHRIDGRKGEENALQYRHLHWVTSTFFWIVGFVMSASGGYVAVKGCSSTPRASFISPRIGTA